MVEGLLNTASSIKEFCRQKTDNSVDSTFSSYPRRLTRTYTVALLLTFSCLITSKQFVGNPIECWCPAQFTDSQVRYTTSYCWISHTHYLPTERIIPYSFSKDSKVVYYQWVPIILLVQSALCLAPALIWRMLIGRSGLNVEGLFEAAMIASGASYLEMRKKSIDYIVSQFDRHTMTQRHSDSVCYSRIMNILSRKCFIFGGKSYGNCIVNCYLSVKILYALNAVGQIYLIDYFLGGKEYHMYGLHVLHGLMQQTSLLNPDHFPTVTLCEIDIRDQSRIHTYVIQCVLSVNIFNEKIFIILWFWFVFVALANICDFLRWLFGVFHWKLSLKFIKKRLKSGEKNGAIKINDPVMLSRFLRGYLRRDGVFLIKLISLNYGDVLVGDVLDAMWECYLPETRYVNVNSCCKTEVRRRKRLSKVCAEEGGSTTQLV
ncbi:hypothetical protein HELRODRAFT_176569 [Helobdella robusta]|uniref:Innexin n=1 Tax=Helobdella robusta TaxID=6412 RepID=T1FAN8_HELRO|nr:hypothetical protein HELRODRAFT_176569 [Helobdella robusta]ESN99802.1 hypothetical protein HELRODRAFT_176569 [Helobdella robusta]